MGKLDTQMLSSDLVPVLSGTWLYTGFYSSSHYKEIDFSDSC